MDFQRCLKVISSKNKTFSSVFNPGYCSSSSERFPSGVEFESIGVFKSFIIFCLVVSVHDSTIEIDL
jgi:hypothetical protein